VNINTKYEKLMEYIYDEYKRSEAFRVHGERASAIVVSFYKKTGIRFETGFAQEEAIVYLHKQGWIENVHKTNHAIYHSDIIPTHNGIKHVESSRENVNIIMKCVYALRKTINKFIRGLSGR
jgi:hypothetical protein